MSHDLIMDPESRILMLAARLRQRAAIHRDAAAAVKGWEPCEEAIRLIAKAEACEAIAAELTMMLKD